MLIPPDRAPPRHREASDRAQLSFKWERFEKVSPELLPLFKKHYAEIAVDKDVCPLDPDWDYYAGIDRMGLLRLLTARASNGKLAGYIFNIVGHHNHYKSTRFAVTEMFYLHPHFRKGWQPVKFFIENLRGLETSGADIATINFKLHFQDGRVGKLLARLGYEACDLVMRRRL